MTQTLLTPLFLRSSLLAKLIPSLTPKAPKQETSYALLQSKALPASLASSASSFWGKGLGLGALASVLGISLCSVQQSAASDASGALLVPVPAPSSSPAVASLAPTTRSGVQAQFSFAPVINQASKDVVSIYAQKLKRERLLPRLSSPFMLMPPAGMPPAGGPGNESWVRDRVEKALGSGVIISPDGLIVTNHHIIAGASQIQVVLQAGQEYGADVVADDPESDLAILRIVQSDRKDPALPVQGQQIFPSLSFVESSALEQGDQVLAIGNPLGLSHTVTCGIISSLGRGHPMGLKGQTYIQTDASINPGNSGGALITADGRLAGICTFILSKSGGSEGLGFVIPAEAIKPVLAAVSSNGGMLKPIIRPWLPFKVQDWQDPKSGLATSNSVTSDPPAGGSHTSVATRGVVVTYVQPEETLPSSFKEKTLNAGDIITAVNGKPIANALAFEALIYRSPIGESLTLTVKNGQGKERTVPLKLMAPPEVPFKETLTVSQSSLAKVPPHHYLTTLTGITFVNLSPAVTAELGWPSQLHDTTDKHVVVYHVDRTQKQRGHGSQGGQAQPQAGNPQVGRSPVGLEAGSAADILQPGDIVLKANQQDIQSTEDLKKIFAAPPAHMQLLIQRGPQLLVVMVG